MSTVPSGAFDPDAFNANAGGALEELAREGRALGVDPRNVLSEQSPIRLPAIPVKKEDINEVFVFTWHKAFWGALQLLETMNGLATELQRARGSEGDTAESSKIELESINFRDPLSAPSGSRPDPNALKQDAGDEAAFHRKIPVNVSAVVDVTAVQPLIERVLASRKFRIRDQEDREADEGDDTRVKVTLHLELWDWKSRMSRPS